MFEVKKDKKIFVNELIANKIRKSFFYEKKQA